MSGRGIVQVEVAGSTRRLRLSLGAIDEIEVALDKSFNVIAQSLSTPEEMRYGAVKVMFEAMAKAGGTPLTDEECDDLLPGDLPEMLTGIQRAVAAAGLEAEPAKKKPAPRKTSARRGESGNS